MAEYFNGAETLQQTLYNWSIIQCFLGGFNKHSNTRQRILAFQLMANYPLHRDEITGFLYVESKLLREFKKTVLRKFSNIERIDLWFFRIYETIQDGVDFEICQETENKLNTDSNARIYQINITMQKGLCVRDITWY